MAPAPLESASGRAAGAAAMDRRAGLVPAGNQYENDDPQPQVLRALGFVNLKPAPCSPCT